MMCILIKKNTTTPHKLNWKKKYPLGMKWSIGLASWLVIISYNSTPKLGTVVTLTFSGVFVFS